MTTLQRGKFSIGATEQGFVAAPASGATITIFDSGADGRRSNPKYKLIALSLYSSHASGTDGVMFETTLDDGTNWRTLVTYTLAATTLEIRRVIIGDVPRWRVRFTNSANTLTAWEMSLVADPDDRS